MSHFKNSMKAGRSLRLIVLFFTAEDGTRGLLPAKTRFYPQGLWQLSENTASHAGFSLL